MSNFKQLITIAIVISIIIVADIIIENYTKKIIDDVYVKLDKIDELLANDEDAKKEAKELASKWEEIEKIMSCYTEHDEIEKIGNSIFKLKKQVELEVKDDARQSITEAKFLFDHIEEKQKLNIENFF